MPNRDYNIPSRKNQYFLSIVTVLFVALVCFGLSPYIGYQVVALILLVTVSIIAISFDIFPVLLSALFSAFIWNFFFIPPRFTIHVGNTEDMLLFIMYFIIAMINAVLTFKIKEIEKVARQREERANSVHLYNTLLDSLSHELRTPIAAIIGATDNLQTNDQLSTSDKELLLSEISKAGLRLNQQVENLLNLSRLESGHIQPKNDWCDVVELVHNVVKRVEENGAGRRINISIREDVPLCYLDKGMLDQVLYNLLHNALQHTDLTCEVYISAVFHTDLLEFIIEDNGKGLPDDERKVVFNKFARIRQSKTRGTGLGLSIVKGFTEAMGGTVALTKGQWGGAQFTVTLHVKTTYIKTYE